MRTRGGKRRAAGALALAWLLTQGEGVVPIFGTRRAANLAANVRAVDLELSADELARLDTLAQRGAAAGDRWSPALMEQLNR